MLLLDFGNVYGIFTNINVLWERGKYTKIRFLSFSNLSYSSYLYFILKDKTLKRWYWPEDERICIIMRATGFLVQKKIIIVNNVSHNRFSYWIGIQTKTLPNNKTTLIVWGFLYICVRELVFFEANIYIWLKKFDENKIKLVNAYVWRWSNMKKIKYLQR